MNTISFYAKLGCTLLFFGLVPALLFGRPATTNQTGPKHRNKKGGTRLQLTSASFHSEGNIAPQFTCEDQDLSPALAWRNAPSPTKSFALIVHDPDAPISGGFTHWVAYNIPATAHQILQGASKGETLEGGGIQGMNDGGKPGYMGPCPPSGTHRYYFYLYALDIELKLKPDATKGDLEKAMEGHVIAKAELMGRYRKGSKKAA